jgi:hypothetical protein
MNKDRNYWGKAASLLSKTGVFGSFAMLKTSLFSSV